MMAHFHQDFFGCGKQQPAHGPDEQDMTEQAFHSTVMIVDDTPANLQLLVQLLHDQGYQVAAFADGRQALAAAATTPPDLIMMDIRMPGMDGLETCRRLKADPKLRNVPVLFISMINDPDKIVQAFAAGGADYVTKPFQPEEVLARVQAHLRLRNLLRETKQCRLELEQANAEKEKIRSTIIHDLKDPMSLLTIAAAMLAEPEETLSDQDVRHVATQMRSALKCVNALLSDLVQWSRMGQDCTHHAPRKHNLHVLIEHCLQTIRTSAAEKNIQVNTDIPPDLFVLVDKDMINTVLRNLLRNAIKYSSRGSAVTISGEQDNGTATIAIQDSGIGMDQAVLDKIFTISTDKIQLGSEGERGPGLDLLLCKCFIERHGGRIWLESERWQGTTAYFTLPAAKGE